MKDELAHIPHWKAGVARSARRQRRLPEERGLGDSGGNYLIYMCWRDHSPQEVLAWQRQAQEDVLTAIRDAPEEWFSGREGRMD